MGFYLRDRASPKKYIIVIPLSYILVEAAGCKFWDTPEQWGNKEIKD